jgi:hypothetical protein
MKLSSLKSLLIVMGLFGVLMGCSYNVKPSLSPLGRSPLEGKWRKVIVLPSSPLLDEVVSQSFYSVGFIPVAREDVLFLLREKGVLKKEREELSPASRAILYHLEVSYTDEIKRHLQEALRHNLALLEKKELEIGPKVLKELCEEFGTVFVVRASLIELKEELTESYNPFEIGFVPFAFNVPQRLLFGRHSERAYPFVEDEKIREALVYGGELLQKLAIGAAGGWAVTDLSSPLEWERDVGTLVGGGLGFLGHLSGKVPEVKAQVRLTVQDGRSGDLLWTNRAEVRVRPESVFSKADTERMRDLALKEAVALLVNDFARFFQEELPKITPIYKEIVWKPEGIRLTEVSEKVQEMKALLEKAQEASEKALKEAERASQEAERAEKAAIKAERIFEKTVRK